MTADKRTPHTDALETLGKIHQYTEHRDAIHLGVEPVEAGERLSPGDHIFLRDGKAYSIRCTSMKGLGIVDPFLTEAVEPGQRFWLVVYPREITSLRHVWEHPDFPDSQETEADAQPTEDQLHKMNVLIGEEKACALQRIRDYAASLSDPEYGDDEDDEVFTITAEELINTAMHNITTSGWGDFISKGGLLEGISTSAQFWEDLAIYKGIDIPHNKRQNFFSCSC